jgi:hypothetical protein
MALDPPLRTDHQLQSWLNSPQRKQALPQLRSQLAEDFSVVAHSTPFGSILRVQDGTTRVTPNWKTAMLVLLVLFPTVMTLSRFLGPVLDNAGAEPWLSMWTSQIVSVGLMTWFLMPVVTSWFRRWLDPVDGASVRVSVIGAGVVLLGYVATLALFATVTWLQFCRLPRMICSRPIRPRSRLDSRRPWFAATFDLRSVGCYVHAPATALRGTRQNSPQEHRKTLSRKDYRALQQQQPADVEQFGPIAPLRKVVRALLGRCVACCTDAAPHKRSIRPKSTVQ